MSETLTALVPMLWQRGLEKLVADVDLRNEGNMRVLYRCCFVGTNMVNHTETDGGWCESGYLELQRLRRSRGRDFSIVVPDTRLVGHVTSSNSIVCPVSLPRLSSLYTCFLTRVIGVLFAQ